MKQWNAAAHPVRREWGTVVQVQAAAREITRLRIAVEGSPLMFAPGQYAELAFEGWPARHFVLANRPGDPLLEVHVQRVPGGMVSEHIVGGTREGARLQLTGPYGASLLRRPAGEPVLMMAGGWGLAALKSVLLTALDDGHGDTGPIHVYHGVPESSALYDAHLLANGGRPVHYVPVSVTPSLDVSCRHGFVHDAVESDFRTLAGFQVYVAGPPLMVQACVTTALRLGARPEDVHAEAFDPPPEIRGLMTQRPAKRGLLGGIFGRYG